MKRTRWHHQIDRKTLIEQSDAMKIAKYPIKGVKPEALRWRKVDKSYKGPSPSKCINMRYSVARLHAAFPFFEPYEIRDSGDSTVHLDQNTEKKYSTQDFLGAPASRAHRDIAITKGPIDMLL